MKVLITGGCGFVGYNLINELIKRDTIERIISIDNYTSGSSDNEINNDKITYLSCDTTDILSNNVVMEYNPDIVFHFGEFSRIALSFDHPNTVFKSNGFGTQQVLQYCIIKSAKLVYSGSSAIFGEGNANLSPYAWLKQKNIELIKNYKTWYGLKYAICYFYNAYGPKHITCGDYATVIGIFEKQYKENKPLTVVGNGLQTRIFTHIDDIVNGIIKVAENGDGDNYHLGRHDNISIIAVAKLFSDNIIHIPERPGERKKSCMPHDNRAETELNWLAENKLEDYIKSVKLSF